MTHENSNILSYYPPVECSMARKLLIEQDVAFTFERLVHNYILKDSKEGRAYGSYLCLLKACEDEEFIGNYIKVLEDYVDEETLYKVVSYIRMGEVPYQLFVNKVIFDLQGCSGYHTKSSTPSMLLILLLKTMRASLIAYNKLHKALMEDYHTYNEKIQNVIDFAYSWYLEYPQQLKNDYMKALHPQTDKERQNALANEISIFTEVLIDMFNTPIENSLICKAEAGIIPKYAALWKEPLDLGGMMSTAVGDGDTAISETTRKKSVGKTMACFATDLCGWGPDGETPEEYKKVMEELSDEQKEVDKTIAELNEGGEAPSADLVLSLINDIETLKEQVAELTKKVAKSPNEVYNDITSGTNKNEAVQLSNEKQIFILKKVAKDGSSRVMWKGKYNTLEEAEKRKEELCNNPDIIKNFDFIIEVGK